MVLVEMNVKGKNNRHYNFLTSIYSIFKSKPNVWFLTLLVLAEEIKCWAFYFIFHYFNFNSCKLKIYQIQWTPCTPSAGWHSLHHLNPNSLVSVAANTDPEVLQLLKSWVFLGSHLWVNQNTYTLKKTINKNVACLVPNISRYRNNQA